jgi:hypothetical protein
LPVLLPVPVQRLCRNYANGIVAGRGGWLMKTCHLSGSMRF